MKRLASLLLPHPLLSFSILIMWLLLNQSTSPGHLIFGSVIALVGAWGMVTLAPERARIRKPFLIIQLGLLVFVDIVKSNIAVAKIIFNPKGRRGVPRFMAIKLDMRSPYGLAGLAIIITSTPGTIWTNFSHSSGILLIHVVDLQDEEAWVDTIKNRYERRLMEIFE